MVKGEFANAKEDRRNTNVVISVLIFDGIFSPLEKIFHKISNFFEMTHVYLNGHRGLFSKNRVFDLISAF